MGEAKRRKERLGDAYGKSDGSGATTSSTLMPAEAIVLSAQNHLIILDHLSREDAINLLEHCKRPGPWECRYVPNEKHRDLCNEIVITCVGDDVVACFWPACRSDQAPSRLPAQSLQAQEVGHAHA